MKVQPSPPLAASRIDAVPCELTEREIGPLLDETTRTWTLNDAALTQHDLQDVIDCAEEDDTVFLQTREIVQPRQRLRIRQSLVIKGTPSDGDEVASVKASITCPLNQGLLLIRCPSLPVTALTPA